ncbi:hypothetical protein HMH01_04650 [Halovulum dunhuangense]|uniref:Cytochrome c oxidase assembly protein n=1 Tax=Halovulum dunhuangense TaxID=1505036 RepID=A0A849L0D6_9RHOB|nr:hypothetical protein [Halovulum dunhuangense]NNU79726.1 hypothetical protein [Halovulum dunhuangense]
MTRKSAITPDTHEIYARRKGRNLALGLCLAAVVGMIFAVTIVKLKSGIELRGFDHTFETVPGTLETN